MFVIDLNLARYLGETYCARKCKKMDIENFIIVTLFDNIDRLQLTSSPPCWMTINKRILTRFIVPVIQHGRQGLCHLNLSGMVANHLFTVETLLGDHTAAPGITIRRLRKRQKVASLILQICVPFFKYITQK